MKLNNVINMLVGVTSILVGTVYVNGAYTNIKNERKIKKYYNKTSKK